MFASLINFLQSVYGLSCKPYKPKNSNPLCIMAKNWIHSFNCAPILPKNDQKSHKDRKYSDLARWMILLAVDIFDVVDIFDEVDNLLWLEMLLMSEPEPNSCSSSLHLS